MTFPCFEIMLQGIKANLEMKKSMTTTSFSRVNG